MLSYDNQTFGTQRFRLDLSELYSSVNELRKFNARYEKFRKSGSFNNTVFSLQSNIFKYSSEVFVSDKIDNRPPVLLLVGNPAIHSVVDGICFACEREGLEHRFWRLLEETGLLTFKDLPPITVDKQKNIEMRRDALENLKYQSPFRIGIAVFYSLPTAAGKGVQGIKTLLWSKAFKEISLEEEKRIAELISRFIGSSGGIIAFQKDAYERVRSQDTPAYDKEKARNGELVGKYKRRAHIYLAGAPPTREAFWSCSKKTLSLYKNWLASRLSANL